MRKETADMKLYTSNPIIFLFCAICLLTACSNEDKPSSFEPQLLTQPATDIMRNSATLNGAVSLEGNTAMPSLSFRYGTSADMTNETPVVKATGNEVLYGIDGLTAGTTYYYMLQANNGRVTLNSEPLSFTTMPNEKPSISNPEVLSYGPTSVILGYDITSDGGEDVIETGCYYAKADDNDDEKRKIILEEYTPGSHNLQICINALKPYTNYQFWTYATNRPGETVSEPISFTTTDAIKLLEAGVLRSIINDGIYDFTKLTIAGDINGDDIVLLRQMAGIDADNAATPGKLSELNLAEAHFVEGGAPFGPYNRFTKPNAVSQGMFAYCPRLSKIILPTDATSIEKDAFEGCTSLRNIEIPANISMLLPSSGCTALETISVSKANTHYSSVDGVLLNADATSIVWFPLGKKGDYTLPATVNSIGDYAFKECNIENFILPDALTKIGQGAFMNSKIKEVSLPDKLKSIPTGTFQGCKQLKIVRMGTKTELISDYVFDNCPLTDIYIDAPTPPVCNSKAFATSGEDFLKTCILHVPKGKKTMYRYNSNWGQFQHIVEQ